jgi:hypothetical protein
MGHIRFNCDHFRFCGISGTLTMNQESRMNLLGYTYTGRLRASQHNFSSTKTSKIVIRQQPSFRWLDDQQQARFLDDARVGFSVDNDHHRDNGSAIRRRPAAVVLRPLENGEPFFRNDDRSSQRLLIAMIMHAWFQHQPPPPKRKQW